MNIAERLNYHLPVLGYAAAAGCVAGISTSRLIPLWNKTFKDYTISNETKKNLTFAATLISTVGVFMYCQDSLRVKVLDLNEKIKTLNDTVKELIPANVSLTIQVIEPLIERLENAKNLFERHTLSEKINALFQSIIPKRMIDPVGPDIMLKIQLTMNKWTAAITNFKPDPEL